MLSGGTAVNMGIVIKEIQEYWDYLSNVHGIEFDRDKIASAYDWLLNSNEQNMGSPMPPVEPWSSDLVEKSYG